MKYSDSGFDYIFVVYDTLYVYSLYSHIILSVIIYIHLVILPTYSCVLDYYIHISSVADSLHYLCTLHYFSTSNSIGYNYSIEIGCLVFDRIELTLCHK